MNPLDPLWLHLAQLAGVKPPHAYHLHAALKQQRGKFNASAYATFASMEMRHVARMLEVFEAEGLCQPAQRQTAPRGERLPADFAVPSDWIAWGVTQRAWPRDVAETVAAEFVDYWHAKPGKDGCKLDWLATWRNWVRSSRRPNGVKQSETVSPEAYRQFCKEQLEHATARGNFSEIVNWRRKLEAL